MFIIHVGLLICSRIVVVVVVVAVLVVTVEVDALKGNRKKQK